ncbi:PTS sugar transporter subunit IIB [Irregularibacter muris]|uniref:PTS sugar transporter subunit IIB n=1 Tax=Irregularibacter muris TaxID=1796619 RepID=A0AAE3HCK1_9FIRM|nr:PTS sugar transporter subunit IIB [Irregularibacter muris]MCR1897640.1 PTS sugar transporter subunit IIB [Irregularibacter muris]
MAEINLVRIDSRLIHGQVITKWLKKCGANRIIIIDDDLAADAFMSEIAIMAAPKGISVEIYSVDQVAEHYKKDQLGKGKLLILLKNIPTVYRTIKKGLPITYIQIGGIASAPGKKPVFRAVSLDDNDVKCLKDIIQEGIEVAVHIIPEETKVEIDKILKKY